MSIEYFGSSLARKQDYKLEVSPSILQVWKIVELLIVLSALQLIAHSYSANTLCSKYFNPPCCEVLDPPL